jgi:hypothetical protein
MMNTRPIACGVTVILALSAAAAHAQTAAEEGRVRVSGTVGVSKLFRIEDGSFGTTTNVGGEAGVRIFPRGWIVFEANRFVGLDSDPAPCSLLGVVCTGGGRTGYESASAGSVNLTYRVGAGRMQLALSGGLGFIRATGVETTTFADGTQVEREVSDHGWGPTAAIGLVVPLGRGWSIDPAVRIYGADGPNLTAVRVALGVTRTW